MTSSRLTSDLLRGAADRLCPAGLGTPGGLVYICDAVEEEAFAATWGSVHLREARARAARKEVVDLLRRHGVSTSGSLYFPGAQVVPDRQALRFDLLNLLACEMDIDPT